MFEFYYLLVEVFERLKFPIVVVFPAPSLELYSSLLFIYPIGCIPCVLA